MIIDNRVGIQKKQYIPVCHPCARVPAFGNGLFSRLGMENDFAWKSSYYFERPVRAPAIADNELDIVFGP
jgi:hypothetical protein